VRAEAELVASQASIRTTKSSENKVFFVHLRLVVGVGAECNRQRATIFQGAK
jgi:hypothetical protein